MKLSKYWTTVTPLSFTLALVFFIFLPFIGYRIGASFNQSKINNQSNNQIQPTQDPNKFQLPATIVTYTSQNLGISFNYEPVPSWDSNYSQRTVYYEIGSKLYFTTAAQKQNPKTDQYIEVFHLTNPDHTIQSAIQKSVLSGVPQKDCYVVTKDALIDPSLKNFTQAYIDYPHPNGVGIANDPGAPLDCPKPYVREFGAVEFFIMDKDHPNTLIFVNSEQYGLDLDFSTLKVLY